MKRILLPVIVTALLLSGNVRAFDNKTTHLSLTEKAGLESSLDLYLKTFLNLAKGINTDLGENADGKLTHLRENRVLDWLMEGSFLEDAPMCRASNHFHNPLVYDPNDPINPWRYSGMRDEPWFVDSWCSEGEYPPENITSAVHWATGYTSPSPGGEKVFTGNQWDWDYARECYYIYLTGKNFQGEVVAGTEDMRKAYLANCFQTVGQVIHLLQDMAVPAHVRDDFRSHLEWFGITRSTLWPPNEWIGERFEHYVKHHEELITGSVGGNLTDSTLTKFWDSDTYDSQDPDLLDPQQLGLAEYTNMNFVSRNTIFTEGYPQDYVYYHPYPRKASTDIQEYIDYIMLPKTVIGEDTIPDTRFYIAKKYDGEMIDNFLAPTYLTRDIQSEPDYDNRVFFKTFKIDDECIREYAGKLIPRAIGYSAALLDYFFRGAIEITLPDSGTYALADKVLGDIDPASEGFDSMTVYAINNSPDGEEMTGGTVTLVVKYRLGQGDQFQNPPTATSYEFHYIVKELDGIQTIPRITPDTPDPIELEFDLSDNQIPLWATDVYIYLIYKGGLGREDGAVAVGFKDISEPTPILYYNVMDQICMDDQLFDSGSSEAIAYVDTDENGVVDPYEWDVYPHNAENIHIRYSPVNNPQDATPETSADNNYEKAILHPNEYVLLFILSDYDFNRSTSVEYTKIVYEDQCVLFHGIFPRPSTVMDAIKNQIDLVDPVYCGYEPCYVRFITNFHSIRGIVSFFSVLFDNASYPIDSECSYE